MTEGNKQTTDELRDLKITSRIEILEKDLDNLKEIVKETKETISSCIETIYKIQSLRVELESLRDRIELIEKAQQTIFDIIDTLRNSCTNNSLNIKEVEGLFSKVETIESGIVKELENIKGNLENLKEKNKVKEVVKNGFWKEISSKTLISVFTTLFIIIVLVILIYLSDNISGFFHFLSETLKNKL